MLREEIGNDSYWFFDSMTDFTNYLIKTEDYFPFGSKSSSSAMKKSSGYHFNEATSWKDFIYKLTHGSKNYSKDDNFFKTDDYDKKFESTRAVNGNPIVPRVLKNLPKSNRKLKRNKKTAYYDIYLNSCELGYVDGEDIKKYHTYIFNKINGLISEANTVSINWYGKSSFNNGKTVSVIINLKNPMYNVDINRLMYFLTSPDLFRRGNFRIYELDSFSEGSCFGGGYGRSLSSRDKAIESKLGGILLHNLISFGGSVERAINDVEKRLIQVVRN